MARPCRYATPKVEEWRSVDLADLRRWRMLDAARMATTGKIPAVTWNTTDGFDKLGVIAQPRGVLFVRHDDSGQLGKLFVPYVFTPTKFGGWRAWFRCPGCGQRCRVLYGVNTLRCRRCRGLKYQSQFETRAFRLLERARKIRRRLVKPGETVDPMPSGDPMPPKPRYMRWRRYRHLEQLVWRLETAGWAAMSLHVGGIGRRLR
jgi:hypothetical protein